MVTTTFSFSSSALATCVLHCYKYPSNPVFGLLLTRVAVDPACPDFEIEKCVPLFHSHNFSGPFVEAAILLVEKYAEQENLMLVGLYYSHEVFDCSSIPSNLSCILQRLGKSPVLTRSGPPRVFLINNANISPEKLAAVFHKDREAQYDIDQSRTAEQQDLLERAISSRAWSTLSDFSDHLEDKSCDFFNSALFS